MIMLGFCIIFSMISLLFQQFLEQELFTKASSIFTLILLLGVSCIMYDLMSPVTTTSSGTPIFTIDADADECVVWVTRSTITESTWIGAISGDEILETNVKLHRSCSELQRFLNKKNVENIK